MTLLGYFGNSIATFNESNDGTNKYMDTILSCLNSPYTISCLAPYGGPVLPGIATSGTKDNQYVDAEAVTLTFLVNNKVNADELDAAMEWEEKYVLEVS